MADDETKSPRAFRTISEVSDEIGIPQHVLRFWESKFAAVRPLKRAGNRRFYRPEDVQLLKAINHLLYTEGYTIKGVQKLLKDRGAKSVAIELGGVEEAAWADTDATGEPNAGAPLDLFDAGQPDETPPSPRPADDEPPVVSELRRIRDLLADGLRQARAA